MKKIIITENQLRLLLENQEYVNSLLDKIGTKGIESLTPSEKKYLDGLSSHEGHIDDYDDPNYEDDYDERRGEKITSSLPNLPQLQFVFDYEEREENEILLYGSVYFQGNEYVGVIVTNENGNLIDFDFQVAEIDFDDTEVTNLLDDAQGLEHELSVFFENDVIPALM
jgi:hypothetical protein